MKETWEGQEKRIHSLGIEQWHALGLEGNMLPVTICLEGDSMRPLIRRGKDPVTILPLSRPLKISDVVLFQGGPGRYVVHRVRKIRENRVQTLGDNCWNPDRWMPLENVWGLVIRMERNGHVIRLDSSLARFLGRVWMAFHPIRLLYRRCRSLAARIIKKLLRMDKTHESA